MSKRFERFFWGFFASIGGTIFLQITTLLATPLYLDYTSQEIYGMWLILISIFGWLQFGDMGIGMSLTKRSIEALEKNDYELLTKYFYAALISFTLIGFIFGLIGLGFYYKIDTLFNIDNSNQDIFKKAFLFLILAGFLSPVSKIFSSIIESHQRIAFLKVSSTLISFFSIIITLILLSVNFGLLSFVFGIFLKVLLTPIVEFFFLKKIDAHFNLSLRYPTKKEFFDLLSFGGKFQILKIANMVTTNVDYILIGVFLSSSLVSVYTFSSKLAILFCIGLMSLLPSVLFPGLSQLFELNDHKKIKNVYYIITKLSLRVGILFSIIFYSINEPFVNLWVGKENFGGDLLTYIFVFWILIECYLRGITAIIYASGKIGKLTIYSIVEAVFNVFLTIYLINKFQLPGVAAGTLISRIVTLFFIPYFINKLISVNFLHFFNINLNVLIHSLPTVIIGIIVKHSFFRLYSDIYYILISGLIIVITNFIFFELLHLIKQKKSNSILVNLKNYYLNL